MTVPCHLHPDRAAERSCQFCQTPLCGQCGLREQTGFEVCSFACADRLTRLHKEQEEAQEFDGFGTRIWSGLFLVVFLGVIGGLAGGFLCFASLRSRLRHGDNMDNFPNELKWMAMLGVIAGVLGAIVHLVRYYTRRE
jgi:hypothetical protein